MINMLTEATIKQFIKMFQKELDICGQIRVR